MSSDWDKGSDEHLLSVTLTTDDTEGVEGLVRTPPPEDEPVPELWYDLKGQGRPLVECAFCQKQNHHHGYVFLYPSGERRLIGCDCASKHYGAKIDRALTAFQRNLDRKTELQRRIEEVQRADLIGKVRALRGHPAIAAFDKARRDIERVIPDTMWAAILRASITVKGKSFLDRRPAIANVLAQLDAEMERDVGAVLDGSNAGAVAQALQNLERHLETLEATQRRLKDAEFFFEGLNLRHIASFAEKAFGLQMFADLGGDPALVRHSRHGDTYQVSIPADYRVPGGGLVVDLRRAVVLPLTTKQRQSSRV